MNSKIFSAASLLFLLLPFSTFAHEAHMYDINGVEYEIVIGSRNEPVVVDDKTGLELEIARSGKAFVGAQDSLKVEVLASGQSRIDNIEPVWGSEGTYKTTYIPTVATTIQYRIFGTLEGKAFDQTYTCNPAGHPKSEESSERIEISDGVTQTHSRGNFGCPLPKEAVGFPEAAPSVHNLENAQKDIRAQVASVQETAESAGKVKSTDVMVLILSLLALSVGFVALRRTRRDTLG